MSFSTNRMSSSTEIGADVRLTLVMDSDQGSNYVSGLEIINDHTRS